VVVARLWWHELVGGEVGGAWRSVRGHGSLGTGEILVGWATPTR
jgi:hypothetical protein